MKKTKKMPYHCMVVHAYYPLAETRVQREAEALHANGINVDVICLRLPSEPKFEVVRGINVYRLPAGTINQERGIFNQLFEYLRFFLLATLKLTRLHFSKRYDVIQVHNLPDFLVFCALIPKLGGTPIVLDIHDVSPELFGDRTRRPPDNWLVQMVAWQEKIACRFASHIITVTEPWRQKLIERGLPAEKSSVVMNVADASLFNPNVKLLVTDKKAKESFHLIYHGVQTYRHGLDILLRAMALVRSKIPPIELTLHGEGEFHDRLVALVAELNLTDAVHFSNNYVPVSELPKLIAQADIGVVPYRQDIFTGGILPTKLMEYMSLGMPAITARTPAITAYFDETMVEFFDSDDVDDLARSLLHLYTDKSRTDQLINGTERFRQQYNWGKISQEYVTLIKNLGKL